MFQTLPHVSPIVHEKVKKLLRTDHVGYVLITAKKSLTNDNLEVDMSYEGEVALASFLLEGAQEVFDELSEEEEMIC